MGTGRVHLQSEETTDGHRWRSGGGRDRGFVWDDDTPVTF